MIFIPLGRGSEVYFCIKPGPIPLAELMGVSPEGAVNRYWPLGMKPLERLEWFARTASQFAARDSFPPGLYSLMVSLGDDIGDHRWFCDWGFYKRGPEDLKRPAEEIERLPLCRLLEALLYLMRAERHDGYWGVVVGQAWERGWVQAVARGVERHLVLGHYPRRSSRGW